MKRIAILLFITSLCAVQTWGQGKAKIIIKKNIDGEETIIEKEYDLEEGQDLSELIEGEDFDFQFDFGDDSMHSFFQFDFDDSSFNPFGFDNLAEKQAFLGITEKAADSDAGVTIAQVIEGSSAELMGLESDDIIVGFNGFDVYDMEDLRRLISESEIGDEVKVEVKREGKRKKLKGELLSAPHDSYGMNEFHMGPSQGFDFDGQMDMAQLEEMMRMMEEQMQGMDLNFEMPEGDLRGFEEDFEWQYDVPGQYHEGGASSLRFDHVTADDLQHVAGKTELSTSDNLALTGLRFLPLAGSSMFELQFSLSNEEDLSVTIFDTEGKMVYYEMLGDFSGAYENVIDLNDREAGDYFLQLSQEGKTFCRKIIKG